MTTQQIVSRLVYDFAKPIAMGVSEGAAPSIWDTDEQQLVQFQILYLKILWLSV